MAQPLKGRNRSARNAHNARKGADHRLERLSAMGPAMQKRIHADAPAESVIECGWGRLLMANSFADADSLVAALRKEREGQRDIAFYVTDPHVLLAKAPQELFLDPSNTMRLWLNDYRPARRPPRGFTIRRAGNEGDTEAINTLYASRNMVALPDNWLDDGGRAPHFLHLLAVEEASGNIIGTITGLDHSEAFDDPEKGSSLWCLAVAPQAAVPGVGQALVRQLAEQFTTRGAAWLDLSVIHNNAQAISLYEKLGFRQIPVFALKTRNGINEKLFIGPEPDQGLNPYARIIVDEARRRGINVEVLDAEGGFFRLTHGGRSVTCRESLSQLTDAVALSRCDDKAVTSRLLGKAGLNVPEQITAGKTDENLAFLEKAGAVVVKPARGEQGRGISVDISDAGDLEAAIERAAKFCEKVLIESFHKGEDLRVIVINNRVVAAAVRRPPSVTGTGQHTIRELIEARSRRREAATDGESSIPLDAETERCVAAAGYSLDDVLKQDETLTVRKAANLHTGGTIHDVTDILHPVLVEASEKAARTIGIPVVGLDFLVPSVTGPEYVIIEANERPGLANHEPQPTAQRFIDLLFPQTV